MLGDARDTPASTAARTRFDAGPALATTSGGTSHRPDRAVAQDAREVPRQLAVSHSDLRTQNDAERCLAASTLARCLPRSEVLSM
jgi:hypothetical protein